MPTYEQRLRALGVTPPVPTHTTLAIAATPPRAAVVQQHQPTSKARFGGSTRLNRFASISSTPKFRGITKAPNQAPSCAPSSDSTIFDRVNLFHLSTDTLLAILHFLAPMDLSRLCVTSMPWSLVPHDNYIWYILTIQRFVIDAAINNQDSGTKTTTDVVTALPVWAEVAAKKKKLPTVNAVKNWYDEYEYLLAREMRAQKYKMAQMQGRLGRLAPIPAHKNRPVVNYFTVGTVKSLKSTTKPVEAVGAQAYGNAVLKKTGFQGQGAAAAAGCWSALKDTVSSRGPDETVVANGEDDGMWVETEEDE